MIRPDAFVISPTSIDYPLWRYHLKQDRHFFNRYIVVWSQTHRKTNVRPFVENNLRDLDIQFVYTDPASAHGWGDWGNQAFHAGLSLSKSVYFLHYHQDFVIRNPSFLSTVLNQEGEKLIGFHEKIRPGLFSPRLWEGGDYCEEGVKGFTRLCPAFWLQERELFNRTCQDVSVTLYKGNQVDHCAKVSMELFQLHPNYKTLEELGYFSPQDFNHYSGIAVLYNDLEDGKELDRTKWTYPGFCEFSQLALNTQVEMCPEFLPLLRKAAFHIQEGQND